MIGEDILYKNQMNGQEVGGLDGDDDDGGTVHYTP